jgi:hypothetical protein
MKSTKSVRLKKYGSVYDSYVRANVVVGDVEVAKREVAKRELPKKEVAKRHSRSRSPKADKIKPVEPVKSSKKNLNDYQKFVKEESVKDKYKNMKGSERMVIISKEWEKKKRKRKK